MIDEQTKFFVEPKDRDKLVAYTLLAPACNAVLKQMEERTISQPTGMIHPVFEQIMHLVPKFRDPIPGLGVTQIEFESYDYVEDGDEESIGWIYCDLDNGQLAVACRPDADSEWMPIGYFITWQQSQMEGPDA